MRIIFISYEPTAGTFKYALENFSLSQDQNIVKNHAEKLGWISTTQIIQTFHNVYPLETFLLEIKFYFSEMGVTTANWDEFIKQIEAQTKIKFTERGKYQLYNTADVILEKLTGDYLDVNSLQQFSHVNHRWHQQMQHVFYRTQLHILQIHFPHIYKKNKTKLIDGRTCYKAFKQAEEIEYKNLNARDKNIMRAFKEGNLAEIKSLLLRLKDFDISDRVGLGILNWAHRNNHQHILDYFYQKFSVPYFKKDNKLSFRRGKSTSLLDHAVYSHQSNDVLEKIYSEFENEINTVAGNGSTVLHAIATAGNLDALLFLLSKEKVKKDFISIVDHATDSNKLTPLYIAAQKNHLSIAQILVSLGASINASNVNNSIPLNIAATANSLECLNYLLENRAEINKRDVYMQTPLHAAAFENSLECSKSLVQHGALLNPIDAASLTPLQWAFEMKSFAVVKYLIAQPQMLEDYIKIKTIIPIQIENYVRLKVNQWIEKHVTKTHPLHQFLSIQNNSSFKFWKTSPDFINILCMHSVIQQYKENPAQLPEHLTKLASIPSLPAGLKKQLSKFSHQQMPQAFLTNTIS